jgi:hypothetical protein
LLSAALAGCSSSSAPPLVDEPAPAVAWPQLTCDALVPSFCAFPFPSNVFTVDDPTTPSGRRLHLDPEALPQSDGGEPWSLEGQHLGDGFSSGTALLVEIPGATEEGLPTPLDLELSLSPASPTVILDAESGERVAHFTELDRSRPEEARSLMLRPVERLADGRRYIVALRNVESASGVVPASPAFAALRDRTVHPDPSIDARRALYADIFARLAQAGVARESLQLAWDFTTASRESNTGWLVHMRDEALAAAGDGGPTFTLTEVLTDGDPERVAYRIEGTFEAPLYLDDPGPGGRLVLGADGLPEPNGTKDVPFLLIIPERALTEPVALLQYGHGLLGSHSQVESQIQLAQDFGYAVFGVTLAGMGDDDGLWISERLASGDLAGLTAMFERLHQGMLDQLLAMRMVSRGLAQDPTYGPLLDASQRYYHGISQGGIFGASYLALSTDVERGVLGVMGMPYNLLLNRSIDFGPFFALLSLGVPDSRAQQLLLSLIQGMWDRTEPNGYTPYLRDGALGTHPHEVLMRAAIGDHQVTTLGAQLMARSVGAVHLDSGLRDIFGLEKVASAASGSAYVEYDFGLPPEPICNIPMTACEDPHGEIRKLPEAQQQLDLFLRSGAIESFCLGGLCSHPELSGCDPDDDTPVCPP